VTVKQPQVQVLVDWTNNPVGLGATAGSNFVDISSFVRLDQPVQIARGRQDNISTVQPSRATFTVDNSSGRFTPGYSSSPYYPGVLLGRRVQINVKNESGTYVTRFDGMLNEIDVNDVATGQGTTATIICTDVIAYLNRYPELSCWTVEYCQSLSNAIMVQYVLNEPVNSTGVSDSQGNGPVLPLYSYTSPQRATGNVGGFTVTAPTATFQSGNSPVEAALEPTFNTSNVEPISAPLSSPLPSVEFSGTISSSGSVVAAWGSSAQFQGSLPQNITIGAGNKYTLVCWVWPNVALNNIWNLGYNQEIVNLGNTRTGQMLGVEAWTEGSSGNFGAYVATYYSNFLVYNSGTISATNFISGGGTWFGGPVMLMLEINGTTATLYVGGNLWGTGNTVLNSTTNITLPTGAVFDYLTIGGGLGGGNGFLGNISNVVLYQGNLSSGVKSTMGGIGAWGPFRFTAGGMAGIVLNMAQVPSYWVGTFDAGAAGLDYFDLTGSQPASALQTIEACELGLFFVDATGKFNWHSRDRRMGTGAPVTTLPAGSYNEGIMPKWNDQYLQNSAALQNERGGVPSVAQNATSIAQYGLYPNGSYQAPTIVPVDNYAGNVVQKQIWAPGVWQLVAQFDSTGLGDTAAWGVNTQSQPGMKLASITVDMLSNTSGQNEYVAPSTLFGLEIDTCIALGENLPWWPNSTEASELFIEGVNETYSTSEATISFYTSPAYQSRGWVPGSTAYGQLDVSARVGAYNQSATEPYVSYLIPTFTATMNNSDGGATSNGYVAVRDLRGLFGNLQTQVQPPLLFTQQTLNVQSVPNNTTTFVTWDGTIVDTTSTMNQYTNGATAAVIWLSGWYEVYATVQFAANATGNRTIWIVQNQTLGNRVVAPASTRGTGSATTGVTTSVVFWCEAGDAIAVKCEQDSGAALNTVITNGGSHMSLRYLGAGFNQN
jgi:hypothetical protein